MKKLGLLLLILLAAITAPAHSKELAYRKAPDFPDPKTAVWLNSPPLTFKELEGRVLLVQVWDDTCGNCAETLKPLKKWNNRYQTQGLMIIGVYVPDPSQAQAPRDIKQTIDRMAPVFPVLVDSDQSVWRSYGSFPRPARFLLGLDRRIVFIQPKEGPPVDFEAQIRSALKTANPSRPLPAPTH